MLSWDPSCAPADTDYEVYEGVLGVFYSHIERFCTTGGAFAKTLTPRAGSAYYLVVSRGSAFEGSYGRKSDGTERPPPAAACRPQSAGNCAP